MTRNFALTSSGQFSRGGGGRTETIEIRPLRPNQATILPGVGVKGKGVKLEVSLESTKKSDYFSSFRTNGSRNVEKVNQTMKIKSTNIWTFSFGNGVNFTNVLRAAFTHTDPKSAKKDSQVKQFFCARVKVARRILVKLTLGRLHINNKRNHYCCSNSY